MAIPFTCLRAGHAQAGLLESFVDRSRFIGTCYRASNWVYAGQTRGFAKKRHSDFHFHGQRKDIYLYPLVKYFRQLLQE